MGDKKGEKGERERNGRTEREFKRRDADDLKGIYIVTRLYPISLTPISLNRNN